MREAIFQKARDFSPNDRAAVERVLGRPLSDEEEVSIVAYPPPRHVTAAEKDKAAAALQRHFAEADARGVADEAEVDAAILEAMQHVRKPGYREQK